MRRYTAICGEDLDRLFRPKLRDWGFPVSLYEMPLSLLTDTSTSRHP